MNLEETDIQERRADKQEEARSLTLLNSALQRIQDITKKEPFPEEMSISNLDEVKAHLRNELTLAVKDIVTAIKALKPPTSIKISNFPKEKEINIPDTVKVSNFSELGSLIERLRESVDALVSKDTSVNVTVPDVIVPEIKIPEMTVPTPLVTVSPQVLIDIQALLAALDPLKYLSDRPNKPISVRMSDGKAFLKAMQAVAEKTGQVVHAFANSAGMTASDYKSVSNEVDDILRRYKVADTDDDASPNYYGFIDTDGNWYILKEVISAGANTYRYAAGSSDYTTNWTGRVGLTYDYFYTVF